MSTDPERERSDDTERELARRRRAAALLGDLVPDATSDDTDEGWGEQPSGDTEDDLRRNVPPHHG